MDEQYAARIASALEHCAMALELLAVISYRRAASRDVADQPAYLDELADWHAELIKKGWLRE